MKHRMLLVVFAAVATVGCRSTGTEPTRSVQPAMGFGGTDTSGAPSSDLPPPVATYLASWKAHVAPNDIAISPDDFTVAIVDAGNHSVELLLRGGSHYRFLAGFEDPRCATFLPSGVLLVGDAKNGSVRGYDRAGRTVLELGQGAGELVAPDDIAVSVERGLIYVVDGGAALGRAYHMDGSAAFSFGEGHLSLPISIAVAPTTGELCVGDATQRSVEIFDGSDGVWKRSLDRSGTGPGEISVIGGLHVDEQGRLYVLEPIGGFVQMFDLEGGYIGRLSEHGTGPGQLRSPKAIAIDPSHRLLVGSYLDRRIEVWGLDPFSNPEDVTIDVGAELRPETFNGRSPQFLVVVNTTPVATALLLDSFLINGRVPPLSEPLEQRTGKGASRVVLRFSTADVLASVSTSPGSSEKLRLTGLTQDGRLVRGVVNLAMTTAAKGAGGRP